jgi:DNA-nicking Smr family endonuclease
MKNKPKNLTSEDEKIWENYSQNVSKIIQKKKITQQSKQLNLENGFDLENKQNYLNRTSNKKIGNQDNFFDDKLLIDKKVYSRLKKGRLRPSKTLDLHGLRYVDAKFHVLTFIRSAYNDNQRLVLIITGKGKYTKNDITYVSNERSGVLRQALPTWLKDNNIRSLILNFTSAHFSHGGSGAFYVYLRKKTYNT